jgi:hypothetical protein
MSFVTAAVLLPQWLCSPGFLDPDFDIDDGGLPQQKPVLPKP